MHKYARLEARVRAVSGAALRVLEAPRASIDEVRLAHEAAYVDGVLHGRLAPAALRRLGLPWSPALVERSLRAVGATLAAARAALADGVAVSLAGGTHHANVAGGAGFCVFNDAAIAARAVLGHGLVERVLIVDCDVHQGDGTARILAGDPRCFTFSIHAARNFPHHKASSHCDIGLPDGCGDDDYLHALASGLAHVMRTARPGLLVYNAGADAFHGDALGRLGVSMAGLRARDELVLAAAGNAVAGVAVVMGGGYADDIDETVAIHAQTVAAAAAACARY